MTAAPPHSPAGDDPAPAAPAETGERMRVGRVLRHAAFVVGIAGIAFLWLDDRFGWLEYRPGGTAFFTYVRPVTYGVMVLGGLLAAKWEIGGAVIGGLGAGAVGAFAINQLVGRHAVLVILLLAVPAVLWLVADAVDWSRRRVAAGVAVTAVAVAVGAGTGEAVYEWAYGPTHPASALAPLPDSPIRWVWSGGVTSTTAEVRARAQHDDATLRLVVVADDDGEGTEWDGAERVAPTGEDELVTAFHLADLTPDTPYRYAVEVDGVVDLVRTGRFRTFPEGPASFRFTVGACARVGSNGAVFDAIRAQEPLVHLIAGDFHYGDIPDDERSRYDEVIDLTLRQPAQAALYRSTPIAYVWDDHDYGVNDSDALSSSRLAAMAAYRANVPSYELASPLSPLYQRFDIGRVRFLLTDARSGREPGVTMLGADQLAWLLDELVRGADEQALVVWLNPVPWVSDATEGGDDWGGYADERELIADTIAEHAIDNLLMVSGDAHMVAIDDGTHTDFSRIGDAGFPLLHAAALDRRGSTKGGPYSEGAIPGGGQYGLVEVDDDGATLTVTLRAESWDGTTLIRHQFTVDP